MFGDREPTSRTRGGAVGDPLAALGAREQHVGYVTRRAAPRARVIVHVAALPMDRDAGYLGRWANAVTELQFDWDEAEERSARGVTPPADVPLRHPEELPTIMRTGLIRRYNGELVVIGGDVLGRVYLYDGSIAWSHCTTHAEHLGDVLRREAGVTADGLGLAMEHCRASGGKLGHALVRLGLLTHLEMRRCVRLHVGAHLGHVLAMSGTLCARFEFDPEHHYDPSLLLSWAEALEAAGVWR